MDAIDEKIKNIRESRQLDKDSFESSDAYMTGYSSSAIEEIDTQSVGANTLVAYQKDGIDPFIEHKRVKKSIKFPMNPAFFKTSLQDRKVLQSLNSYCRSLKVPLNARQNVEYVTERAKM